MAIRQRNAALAVILLFVVVMIFYSNPIVVSDVSPTPTSQDPLRLESYFIRYLTYTI